LCWRDEKERRKKEETNRQEKGAYALVVRHPGLANGAPFFGRLKSEKNERRRLRGEKREAFSMNETDRIRSIQ
jgi:hypothetical protein